MGHSLNRLVWFGADFVERDIDAESGRHGRRRQTGTTPISPADRHGAAFLTERPLSAGPLGGGGWNQTLPLQV